MYTCALDVLHDTGDQHILPVRNDIHLQLGAGHIFIHQHRILNSPGEDAAHIYLGLLPCTGDRHVLPANDIGRTQQHRITQIFCCFQRLRKRVDSAPARAADAEALQQGIKASAVFSHVDAVSRGTKNVYTPLMQKAGKLDGSLPAEGDHNTHGLFHLQNIPDVFRTQRLKIQAICRIVVC